MAAQSRHVEQKQHCDLHINVNIQEIVFFGVFVDPVLSRQHAAGQERLEDIKENLLTQFCFPKI